MSLRPMTTARAPAIAMSDRSSSSMTPDGVQAASVARFCTSRPTLIGWKPSTSLSGSIASNTRRSASAPIAAGQRRLHQDAVVHVAAIQALDERQQFVERRRRRQPLEIGAQPGLARRLQLAADVELRRRVVADQHDAEPRRPAGARRERRDGRRRLRARI